MSKRPEWDDYFLAIVKEVAKRATCDRGQAGCVMVKEKQILTTGYVGSPSGTPHCDEVGHEFRKVTHNNGKTSNHCVRTVHAEQNAICQAAKFGISLRGATVYCTMTPCYTCAKMIINAGIKRVVALKDYHDSEDSKRIFRKAEVWFEIRDPKVLEYDNQ